MKQSIQSGGVKNLFADAGEDFSLFDPKFLGTRGSGDQDLFEQQREE